MEIRNESGVDQNRSSQGDDRKSGRFEYRPGIVTVEQVQGPLDITEMLHPKACVAVFNLSLGQVRFGRDDLSIRDGL